MQVLDTTTRVRVGVGWSVLLIIALFSLVLSGPAGAHAELLQASPGPTQRVGGEIDFIDLVFIDFVTGGQVTVEFDGEVVPGVVTEPEGQFVRFKFDEPITAEGRYDVTYRTIGADLDDTTESYFFTYAESAPQPVRLGIVEPEGRNWPLLIASAVLIVSMLGVAFLLLGRVEQKRARSEPSESGR